MFLSPRPAFVKSGLLALLVLLLLMTPGPANPRFRPTAHPGFQPAYHPAPQAHFHPAPQARFQPVHAAVQRPAPRVAVNQMAHQRVAAIQARQLQGFNAMPYRLAPVTHRAPVSAATPVVLRPGTVNPFRPVQGPTNVFNTWNSTRQNTQNTQNVQNVKNTNFSGLRMLPTPLAVASRSTPGHTTAIRSTAARSTAAGSTRVANWNFGQLGRLHSSPNQVFTPRTFNFTNNSIVLNENLKKIQQVVQFNRGPQITQVSSLQKVMANLRSPNRSVTLVKTPVKAVKTPVKLVKTPVRSGRPAASRPLVNLQQQFVKLMPGSSSSSSGSSSGFSSGLPFPSFLGGPAAAAEEMLGQNLASGSGLEELAGVGNLPGISEFAGAGNLAEVGNLPGLGSLPIPRNLAENFAAPEGFGVAPLGFNPMNAVVMGLGTVVSSFAAQDQGPAAVLLQELVGVQQAAQQTVDDLLASQVGELLAPPPAPEE